MIDGTWSSPLMLRKLSPLPIGGGSAARTAAMLNARVSPLPLVESLLSHCNRWRLMSPPDLRGGTRAVDDPHATGLDPPPLRRRVPGDPAGRTIPH